MREPLIPAFGPGAETRFVIGTVVFSGAIAATAFTPFVVPVAHALIARRTGSPGDVARRLERELSAPAKPKPLAEIKTAERPAAE